jgi:hypothetical protein
MTLEKLLGFLCLCALLGLVSGLLGLDRGTLLGATALYLAIRNDKSIE